MRASPHARIYSDVVPSKANAELARALHDGFVHGEPSETEAGQSRVVLTDYIQ